MIPMPAPLTYQALEPSHIVVAVGNSMYSELSGVCVVCGGEEVASTLLGSVGKAAEEGVILTKVGAECQGQQAQQENCCHEVSHSNQC